MKKHNLNNTQYLSGPEILKEMSISWSKEMFKETKEDYQKVSRVIPEIEWPFFAPYINCLLYTSPSPRD